MKEIKLSEYAKIKNRCYRTMWNHFHNGKLENAYMSDSGSIYVRLTENKKEDKIITYARVSSHEQKNDLIRQEERLVNFANSNGYVIYKSYREIASGLNDKRPNLQKILEDDKVTKIIIENKDRLTRFGFNYIETLLKRSGVEIIVMNDFKSDKDELLNDFISVITSFCARIYGLRRLKNKKKELISKL